MPTNLENSAVATGLEKVSFNSNLKGQLSFQSHSLRMVKLPYSCTHFTYYQDYAPNPSSQASAVNELRISNVQVGFWRGRGTRDQTANIHWIIEKAREFQKNIYFRFTDYFKAFYCVGYNKLWTFLKKMGVPDHFTCLLRNLCAGQEATVRTGHELRTSRCTSWVLKKQKNQRSNCQYSLDHKESKGIPEIHLLLLHWLCESLWLCWSQQTVENS